jgi:hypothetical protein
MAGAVDYEIVFLSHSRNRLGGVVHADSWSIEGGLRGEKARASLLVLGARPISALDMPHLLPRRDEGLMQVLYVGR